MLFNVLQNIANIQYIFIENIISSKIPKW